MLMFMIWNRIFPPPCMRVVTLHSLGFKQSFIQPLHSSLVKGCDL